MLIEGGVEGLKRNAKSRRKAALVVDEAGSFQEIRYIVSHPRHVSQSKLTDIFSGKSHFRR